MIASRRASLLALQLFTAATGIFSVAAAPAFAQSGPATAPAYFKVSDTEPHDSFVIELTNPELIAKARAILDGRDKEPAHVMGVIVKEPAKYNKPWSFHLAPDSISFFQMSTEVCDASTSYVQEHLAEVGGSFLPGNRWCPWSSKIVAEVKHP